MQPLPLRGLFSHLGGRALGAGRPSLYSPELLEKAREYVDNPTDEFMEGDVIHTIVGLALHMGITRETVRVWAADPDKAEFSAIVDRLMAKQERQLVNGGLSSDFNASITKLALTKHNYADKVESDNTHSIDFSNLSDDDLKRIIDGE